MGNAHALPRTKRRKIRPPHPLWWMAMIVVTVSLLSIALYVVDPDEPIKTVVGFVAAVAMVYVHWPQIVRPYKPVYLEPAKYMGAIALSVTSWFV